MYASPSIRGYFGIAGHRPGHHAGWPGLDHYHRWREEVAGLGWVAWRAALTGTRSARPGWLPEADFGLQAAARLRADGEGSAVRLGDGLDDRQPEAEALAVAGAVGAEPL